MAAGEAGRNPRTASCDKRTRYPNRRFNTARRKLFGAYPRVERSMIGDHSGSLRDEVPGDILRQTALPEDRTLTFGTGATFHDLQQALEFVEGGTGAESQRAVFGKR